MYTIELHYTTGNSFGSHKKTNTIGLLWENKGLAKKALATLKEQYKLYSEQEKSYRYNRSNDQIYKEVQSKEWYIKALENEKKGYKPDTHYWWYDCCVEMDDGKWRNLPTSMYCGYFETLHSAQIKLIGEEDEDYVEF